MLGDIESIVTRARMFRHKPDGQATYMMLQDANKVPIPVMQDPIHYPHGTGFLAPGAPPPLTPPAKPCCLPCRRLEQGLCTIATVKRLAPESVAAMTSVSHKHLHTTLPTKAAPPTLGSHVRIT